MAIFKRRSRAIDESSPRVEVEPEGPDVVDTFTTLAADAIANPGGASLGAFWKAVFELEYWHFMPHELSIEGVVESMGAGRPAHPLVVQCDGKRYVAAFTSKERVRASAKRNGFVADDGDFAILSMPRDAAATYLCRLPDDQVDGVLFNHNRGERGMFASLDNVAAMYEHLFNRIPLPMFDRFARSVAIANHPNVWARLHRRFCDLEHWVFLGDEDRPDAPQITVAEDRFVVMAFINEEHAALGARAFRGDDEIGAMRMIEMTPENAVNYLEQLQSRSAEMNHPVNEVLVNVGSVPFLVAIDDLRRLVPRS